MTNLAIPFDTIEQERRKSNEQKAKDELAAVATGPQQGLNPYHNKSFTYKISTLLFYFVASIYPPWAETRIEVNTNIMKEIEKREKQGLDKKNEDQVEEAPQFVREEPDNVQNIEQVDQESDQQSEKGSDDSEVEHIY